MNPESHLCPIGGWLPDAVYSSKANQGSPVLEPHRVPLEHSRRTMPILVRVISLEQSVPEPLLFGAPSFHFTLPRRLTPLPPAPFYASDERDDGLCHTLTVKGVTILTPRTRLLQIVEILPPGWSHSMHDVPPCHADNKKVRRPQRILGERAGKTAYDAAELEGGSRGIGLRGARCVTVMFLGWHVIPCPLCILHDVEK